MNAVVLLSGGLDSTVALADSIADQRECLALTFRYGQAHVRELDAAQAVATHYGVEQVVVDLPVFTGSALTGCAEMPTGHAESVDSTYVPARNAVFLSVGAALAEARGAGMVVYGANFDDKNGYPDCRPEFITAMNNLLTVGMARPVWIHAPFVSLTKRRIVEYAAELNVPLHLTWSCYRGRETPCNNCGACQSRNEAMR